MLTSHGFSRAAVVGAGLMGRRIAGVLASAGLDVATPTPTLRFSTPQRWRPPG
ncbi:3-hydroxybutyrate dehydrogenase [Mycobacterium tuberculosis]|nr:3-hydroxybutyrate dehydrogenase [Mycobacterium tuberculosis]